MTLCSCSTSTGCSTLYPTTCLQARYRQHRPMVERSLAWITRGNRRLRYRGTARNNAWLQLRVGAINLRRLLALGLERTDSGWALAN